MPDLGAALFQLGDTTARTAVAAFDYLDRVQQRESQAAAIQRLNQLRRYSNEQMPTLTTGDPDTWLDRVGQTLQAERDRLAGDLSPDAAQAFYQMADDWFTGTQGQVATLRNQAAPQYHHGRMMTTIQETAALTDNWTNAGMASSEQTVRGAYEAIPEEYRTQTRDQYVAAFRQAAIMRNIEATLRTDPRATLLRLQAGQYPVNGEARTALMQLAEDATKSLTVQTTIEAQRQFGVNEQNFYNELFVNKSYNSARTALSNANNVLTQSRASLGYVTEEEQQAQQTRYTSMTRALESAEEAALGSSTQPPSEVADLILSEMNSLRSTFSTNTAMRQGEKIATVTAAVDRLRENPRLRPYMRYIWEQANSVFSAYITPEGRNVMTPIIDTAINSLPEGMLTPAEAERVRLRTLEEIESQETGGGQTPFYAKIDPELVGQVVTSVALEQSRSNLSEGMRLLLGEGMTRSQTYRMDDRRGSTGLFSDASSLDEREKIIQEIQTGNTAGWRQWSEPAKRQFELVAREAVVDFVARAPQLLTQNSDAFDMITINGQIVAAIVPRIRERNSPDENADLSTARFFMPAVRATSEFLASGAVEEWWEVDRNGERIGDSPIQLSERRRNVNVNANSLTYTGQRR